LVVAGYLGLTLLFILIYFLAGYLPESTATLGKLLQDVALNLTIALPISFLLALAYNLSTIRKN
jgi:hypothetical protein